MAPDHTLNNLSVYLFANRSRSIHPPVRPSRSNQAIQVGRVASVVGNYRNKKKHGLTVETVIGGGAYKDLDIKQSKIRHSPPHVLVGSPKLVAELVRRGALDMSTVRTVVLDEADAMIRGLHRRHTVGRVGWWVDSVCARLCCVCFVQFGLADQPVGWMVGRSVGNSVDNKSVSAGSD